MNAADELAQIAKRLEELAQRGDSAAIVVPLSKLQASAEEVGKSASGSWLGYHALVYYEELKKPPPDAHFDQEWGFMDAPLSSRTSGSWLEYDRETVVEAIQEKAGSPDLEPAREFDDGAREEIETCKSEILSILQTHTEQNDPHLESVRDKIDEISLLSQEDVIIGLLPRSKVVTRDSVAINQGHITPPHIHLLAGIMAMRHTRKMILGLIKLVNQAVRHISRQQAASSQKPTVSRRIFIGHGHSAAWRELKDFIENRLGLQTDEFNSEPTAGKPTTERLEQMLNAAAVAFLVMTGEDEQHDGKSHARLNVVHEVGLFRGRLGFKRAIVLLEDKCEEFSNIAGLGQIRFPKDHIKSTFEGIRQILEREGVLKARQK